MIETHERRFGNALYFNEIYLDFSTQYLSYHIWRRVFKAGPDPTSHCSFAGRL